jgi:phosphotransferase system HPr-like phosphotransfer protein
MALLMLGAGKGTTLRIVVDGPDEEKALDEVLALFAAKFYEAD